MNLIGGNWYWFVVFLDMFGVVRLGSDLNCVAVACSLILYFFSLAYSFVDLDVRWLLQICFTLQFVI